MRLVPTPKYPSFGKGVQVFVRANNFFDRPNSDARFHGKVFDYYYGEELPDGNPARPYHPLTMSGVDGVSVVLRWNAIQNALNVYDWAYIDLLVANARSFGKKIAFYIWTHSYQDGPSNQRPLTPEKDGGAYHSFVPEFIMDDHVTYGGVANFGGEVLSGTAPGMHHGVRWYNPNVMARYTEFVTALGNRYKDVIEYAYFDEFWADIANSEVDAIPGGGPTIIASMKEYIRVNDAAFAGSTTKVFTKQNYLKSSNNDAVSGIVEITNWCKGTGRNFASECTQPIPYDYLYAKNLGTTINSQGLITILENLARSFPSSRPRLVNSDSLGATMGQMTPDQALVAWRSFARTIEGSLDGGYVDIQLIDGMPRPEQPTWGALWKLMSPMLFRNYLLER